MSKVLAKWMQHKTSTEKKRPKRLESSEERRAFSIIAREAREHGAKLKNAGGRGGLPAALVLHVLRRDGYQCKVHGDRGEDEFGGLTLHHKGGILASRWLKVKGHQNTPNNLVTLCERAHNELHAQARQAGVDSSQKPDK